MAAIARLLPPPPQVQAPVLSNSCVPPCLEVGNGLRLAVAARRLAACALPGTIRRLVRTTW